MFRQITNCNHFISSRTPLACALDFNNITNKMIRKNIIQHAAKESNSSVATQTDEFLIFVPIQNKLKALNTQYHHLQSLHQSNTNKIQYLQHKNKLLEYSLTSLLQTLNGRLIGQNIKHLKEIVDLQKLIELQTEQMKRQTTFRVIQHGKNMAKGANFEEQKLSYKYISKQAKRLSSSKTYKYSKTPKQCAAYQKSINQEPEITLFQEQSSENEFLVFDKTQFYKNLNNLEEKSKNNQPRSSLTKIISITSRPKSSQPMPNTTKNKINKDQKQNRPSQKMLNLDTQLKVTKFKTVFQKASNLNLIKPELIAKTKQPIAYNTKNNASQNPEKQPLAFKDSILKNLK